jgi:hypothetical protein
MPAGAIFAGGPVAGHLAFDQGGEHASVNNSTGAPIYVPAAAALRIVQNAAVRHDLENAADLTAASSEVALSFRDLARVHLRPVFLPFGLTNAAA